MSISIQVRGDDTAFREAVQAAHDAGIPSKPFFVLNIPGT